MIPPAGTTTTMDAAHEAILSAMRERFGERVKQYGAYEPWDLLTDEALAQLQTPILLLELEDFALEDTGDPEPLGRMAVRCTWTLHCVLSMKTERLQQTLPQYAAAVAAVVVPLALGDDARRGNQWGLGPAAELPERVGAQPGRFVSGLHGRDEWVVRWEQVLYIEEELPT